MRPSQIQEIGRTIVKNGFSVSDFNCSQIKQSYQVLYKRSGMYCSFVGDDDDWDKFIIHSILYKPTKPMLPGGRPASFATVLANFETWLHKELMEYVRDEKAIDPFSKTVQQNVFNAIGDQDESKFDDVEKSDYKSKIDNLETFIHTKFQTTVDQWKEIQKELEYLKNSLDRLNKRDFKSVSMKTIYDISMNVGANVIAGYLMK